MALFGRKHDPPPGGDRDDEIRQLRESIRDRKDAPIAEASSAIQQFVAEVLEEAGASGDEQARAWSREQIKFLVVAIPSPQWFEMFQSWNLPERAQLHAEFVSLAERHDDYGPEHFVAWWWNIQRSLFEPLVAGQLRQMKDVLVEIVQETIRQGGDFGPRYANWQPLF